jgi:polyisoprenyl-teichoic acid--peptidoglycan teichoic acid transferase
MASSSSVHTPGSGASLTDPVRYPASASPAVRTKRAFVLVLLTLLVPGSAQLVAGDRKLGRTALRVTLCAWAVLLLTVVLLLLDRSMVINIVTNPVTSLVLVILLGALAVGWALLFVNTLRIIRPVLLAPPARPAVGIALVLALVLGSGSMGYAAYLLNVGRNAIGSIFSSGPAIEPVEGRYNFLMMG